MKQFNFFDGFLQRVGFSRSVKKTGEPWVTADDMFGNELARLLRLGGRSRVIADRISQIREYRSWVFACADLISGEVAKTPYMIEKMIDTRTKTFEATNDLDIKVEPLLTEPFTPYGDTYTLWRLTALSLCICGDFFINKLGSIIPGSDMITGLTPIDPSRAQALINGQGLNPGDLRAWQFGTMQAAPDQIIFGRYPRIDNLWRGMSPIEAITLGIDLNIEGGQYNVALLRNDARPSLLLSPEDEEIDDEGLKQAKRFADAQRGQKGGIKILPLRFKKVDAGLDLRMLDMSNMRKLSKDEILAGYHTPETLITGKDANKSTMPTTMQFWLDTAVDPVLTIIENAFTNQFIRPISKSPIYRLRFKRRIIESAEDRQKRIEMEFNNAALTVNDYLIPLGRKPYPWGDDKPVKAQPPALIPGQSPEPIPVEDGTEEEENPKKVLVYRTKPQTVQRSSEVRAQMWRAWDNLVKAAEPHLVGAISRHFDRSKSITLARAKKEYESTGRVAPSIFDEHAAAADLAKVVKPFTDSLIERGFHHAEAQLGHTIEDDHQSEGKTFSMRMTEKNAREMSQTTKDKITALLQTVTLKTKASTHTPDIDEEIIEPIGISFEELESQIGDIFNEGSEARAAMAGQTISVGSVNWGTADGYRADGVDAKEWLTQQDDRVRDSHQALDSGEAIPLTAKFANGCSFPGDPEGEPGEIINCRCTLLPVIVE